MFITVFERSGVQIGWTYGKCSVIHLKAKLRLWIMFRLEFQEISGLPMLIIVIKKKHRKCATEMLKVERNKSFHTQMAETGQMPGRAELYLATHKNVDGAYVNEAAKLICVS
ncbi:uncharacterized protein LOC114076781 [Solanum pennellii]|uniref:Uncharacterized protein LOC114076781 n=1 Tax=Solanum pennellii TaxID=28526 RepID=A0ABM1V8M0_SOLPN|nr:uncharacterized protein LOC114076781 [Solanum pennellii]